MRMRGAPIPPAVFVDLDTLLQARIDARPRLRRATRPGVEATGGNFEQRHIIAIGYSLRQCPITVYRSVTASRSTLPSPIAKAAAISMVYSRYLNG